jgi:hypothetical protein
MMLKKVLGVVASWYWLYFVAKPPHVGVNVDVLACPYTVIQHTVGRCGDMECRWRWCFSRG